MKRPVISDQVVLEVLCGFRVNHDEEEAIRLAAAWLSHRGVDEERVRQVAAADDVCGWSG